jgi:hypothetical protein
MSERLWYAVLLVSAAGAVSVLAYTFPFIPFGLFAAIPHAVTLYAGCMAYGVRRQSVCILGLAAVVSAVNLLQWCVPLPDTPWTDPFEQGLALVAECWLLQLPLSLLALGFGIRALFKPSDGGGSGASTGT